MLSFLNQPYPSENFEPVKKLRNGFLQGLFVALFLILFQPFDINLWQHPLKYFYLSVFGLITMLAYYLITFIPTAIFKAFYLEENWTVGKEIFHIFCLLLLLAIGNLLFVHSLFGKGISMQSFLAQFFGVVIIGIFPIAISVAANYIYQLKKYGAPLHLKTKGVENQLLVFVAENGKDFFKINQDKLLYIENADNYAIFFFLNEDNALKKEILRSSLSKLEEQSNSKNICRTHRSYIANLGLVKKVSGNAQGYKLHFEETDFLVPVARKYADLVKERL